MYGFKYPSYDKHLNFDDISHFLSCLYMNKDNMVNINMKKYRQVMGFIGISLCLRMKKTYIVKQLCPWENVKRLHNG